MSGIPLNISDELLNDLKGLYGLTEEDVCALIEKYGKIVVNRHIMECSMCGDPFFVFAGLGVLNQPCPNCGEDFDIDQLERS